MFCKALEEVGDIDVGDNQSYYLGEGNICVVAYAKIKHLLLENRVQLL